MMDSTQRSIQLYALRYTMTRSGNERDAHMKRKNSLRQLILIGIASLVFWSVAFCAQPVANNQATVAVTDRSPAALQLAFDSAFAEVMTSVSQNLSVMSIPAVKKAATQPTRWVQSYSYQQASPSAQNPSGLTVTVVFDQSGLMQLLTKNPTTSSATTAQASANAMQVNKIALQISGVRNIADYTQVMHSLRDKEDVMSVSVNAMQSDHVILNVKIMGNSADFQKMMAADTRFKPMLDGAQAKQLDYYWTGNQA